LASRIYAAMGALHLDHRAANALGYAIGCPVSFLLNRSWTFRYRGPLWESLVRWLGGHWAIENSLHWVMDTIFRDDECRGGRFQRFAPGASSSGR
jgi:putative flippase GtrA